ncbi:MAG: hypothetical protein M1825_003481 [Sarcosagium campestre]|nr:MAG: hypothetical protein M1825_003481 [Sarcosagium campestre]
MFGASLPEHCAPSSTFLTHLSAIVHICVPTPLALLSTSLGCLSIASWLFAQLPQIFKNYQLKSTSGLSIYFLVEWLLGDTTNLLGALLTRQAAWQVVIAAYYVFVDLVLVLQFIWYTRLQSKPPNYEVMGSRQSSFGAASGTSSYRGERDMREDSSLVKVPHDERPSMSKQPTGYDGKAKSYANLPLHLSDGDSLPGKVAIHVPPLQRRRTVSGPYTVRRVQQYPPGIVTPKTILFVSLLCTLASAHPGLASTRSYSASGDASPSASETAGRVLSWLSTILYLGSRLPQLYKNHKRQSTSGLSAKLFIAAFFGNLFYSSSLLTNPFAWNDYPPYGGGGWAGTEGNNRKEWIERAVPFWLGAAGVLGLDGAVGVQFLMFGEHPEEEIVKDREGHWRRVTGWMRGWVPRVSRMSPNGIPRDEDERASLLSVRSDEYGAV